MLKNNKGKLGRLIELFENMYIIKNRHSKSLLSQVYEMLMLLKGPGKISPSEYIDYRLFDEALEMDEKLKFLGWRMQESFDKLTGLQWWGIVEDKFIFSQYLTSLGFSCAETIAFYQPHRVAGSVKVLMTRKELQFWLEKEASYPLFSKPNAMGRGADTFSITKYDKGYLHISNGKKILFNDFFSSVQKCSELDGYLFQKTLSPHPKISAISNDILTTLRVVAINSSHGPKLISVVWRIPGGDNYVDNFSVAGNILCGVDINSGEVTRVIRGYGLKQESLERHPDNHILIKGKKLPCWDKVIELALALTASIPQIKSLGWDLALSDKGPVVLEANIGGDIDVPQIGSAKGLLTNDVKVLLGL